MLGLKAAILLGRRWLPSALALAGLLAGALLPDGALIANDGRPRTVLILIPGQPTGTQSNIDAFAAATRRTLLDSLPVGSSVYLEYTDLARPGADPARLRDWYKSKYEGQPIDLVIGGGQEARVFLTRFRSQLWREIPILLAAMDDRSMQTSSVPPGAVVQTTRCHGAGTHRG